MKRFSVKSIAAFLAVLILMTCVNALALAPQAATQNGYDRGYDGGFTGDGKIYCEGLDLSSWQENAVNFTAIAAMGYDYIILRLGTSKMTERDRCFDDFYTKAKAAGLDVGAYFYSYATTQAAVEEDIAKCKEWLHGYKLEYPFYFDYEDKSQADLPTDTALSIINTFIDAFVEEGYLMGLYSMKSWLTQSWVVNSDLPSTYEGWIAHYAGDGTYDAGYSKYGDTYSTQYGMYQYTDKHYFTYNGVKYGPYDADICYKDYPTIVKTYGFNGYEPSGTAVAKESLQAAIDSTLKISHRNYTEAKILEIRKVYKEALMLIASASATAEELGAMESTLRTLLATTGSNTIAYNNEGIEIKGRNRRIVSGDCVLYSPTWNNGLITVSNANIAYTINVVFKWDETQKFNVVKSVTYGTGVNTEPIQLEADEFLIAAHDWELGITEGAVEGSSENYRLLSALQVGDRIKLSGATALNAGTDVEPAAFAKFLPKDSVAMYQRNEAVTAGSSVLFTAAFNGGLLTATNSNVHLTLNVKGRWDNPNNAWVVTEKWNGTGKADESSNVELASDEVLFAVHYNMNDDASIYNWCQLNEAEVGQKITFAGISPQSYSTGISVAANISFSDPEDEEITEVVPEDITSSGAVTANTAGDLNLSASLTDGVAETDLEGKWFGFVNDSQDKNCNTEDGVGTVTVDLGARYDISELYMHFYIGDGAETLSEYAVGAPKQVDMFVSVDGTNYYPAGDVKLDDCAFGACWASISDASAVARYIKLKIASEGELTLLNEIRILGNEHTSSAQNIALGKEYVSPVYPSSPFIADLTDGKATQIFQYGANNSSWFGFYNSGDQNTGNINPNNANRGIATLDLGGEAEITEVRINHFVGDNGAGATTFDYINVYYSDDGIAYDYFGYIAPNAQKTSPYWVSFDKSSAPVNARYLKFAVAGSQGKLILINEIEVMGTMLTSGEAVQVGSISTVTLVGEFNNWNATPNMTVVEEDVVSTTLELSKGRYEFKILGGNSWYGYNGEINNTTERTDAQGILMYEEGNNGVLLAAGGKYTFIYNKMTNYLKVLYVPDTCYIRGDFNEWGTTDVLEENEDGTFSKTLTLEAGTYEFKAANEDFSMEWPQFNQSITLDRKTDVTFTLNIQEGTLTTTKTPLEYFITFLDYSGKVLSEQTVAPGENAQAPAAPERSGYAFTGWSYELENVTQDMTVKPLYVKTHGTLNIYISGGTGFTISVNGGAPRPQGYTYMNSKTPIGATVTVEAKATAGTDFIGWIDPVTGIIVSQNLVYTFTASGNDFLKAMFVTELEGVQMVIFKNDKANRILDSQYYCSTDEIIFPQDPTQVGFDFAGWNMTQEEIRAEIEAGTNVTVLAKWTKVIVPVQVTVIGGSGSGTFPANNQVTVTADTAPAGQKFAYWTDPYGNIKSYNAQYSFFPTSDTTMTAVFVAEDETVDHQILVSMDSIDTVSVSGKNVFTYSWYCPESYTFVKAGLVAVNKSNYNEDTFVAGSADGNVYDRSPSGDNLIPVNTFTWTKSNVTSGQTWMAKAYVQYRDASGSIVTVYSDILEATKD